MLDRLNRIDEKLGFRRPVTQKRWNQSLRLWWVGPMLAVLLLLLAQIVGIVWDIRFEPFSLLGIVPMVFISGFFYAHRLRQLGRQSGLRAMWEPCDDDEPTA